MRTFDDLDDLDDFLSITEPIDHGVHGEPVVTQQLLQEFLEAVKVKAAAVRAYQEIRQKLLAHSHAGDQIEAGELSLTVKQIKRRALTKITICAAFGEAEYERLAAGVEPSISDIVIVEPANE